MYIGTRAKYELYTLHDNIPYRYHDIRASIRDTELHQNSDPGTRMAIEYCDDTIVTNREKDQEEQNTKELRDARLPEEVLPASTLPYFFSLLHYYFPLFSLKAIRDV